MPRVVSVRSLLHWTFGVEHARLDFDELASVSVGYPGVSAEYRLMQRQLLGCQVDGGGQSDPHDDAQIVASIVSALPIALGGRGMAVLIAALARGDLVPDTMPDARAVCEPLEWRANKHGKRYAKTSSGGPVSYVHRGQERTADVRLCPVRFRGTAQDLAAMRRGYIGWRLALLDLRCTLQVRGVMACHIVTDKLPPIRPWQENC
jgi:hypothetical protein